MYIKAGIKVNRGPVAQNHNKLRSPIGAKMQNFGLRLKA